MQSVQSLAEQRRQEETEKRKRLESAVKEQAHLEIEESRHAELQQNLKQLENALKGVGGQIDRQTFELASAIIRGLMEVFQTAFSELREIKVERAEIQNVDGLMDSMAEKMEEMGEKMVEKMSGIVIESPRVELPEIEVTVPQLDLGPVVTALERIKGVVQRPPVIKSPEITVDMDKVVAAIEELRKVSDRPDLDIEPLKLAIEEVGEKVRTMRFPKFTPATQMDINPLRGSVVTTQMTVGTTATALPATALANRRTIMVYNEDASVTMRIGGSNVAMTGATAGIPVPAGTYSPPFDIGPRMPLYGIVTSGSITVTVIELSNDSIGSA